MAGSVVKHEVNGMIPSYHYTLYIYFLFITSVVNLHRLLIVKSFRSQPPADTENTKQRYTGAFLASL